jgi:hypothetical protein
MRSVEVSIHRLIASGFNLQMGHDPYRCFVYTSFQEGATKISHRRTAELGKVYGARTLANVCTTISVRSALSLPHHSHPCVERLATKLLSTIRTVAFLTRPLERAP